MKGFEFRAVAVILLIEKVDETIVSCQKLNKIALFNSLNVKFY